MQIIKEQLGRIRHFLLILIPLFTVNAVFNLRYTWDGVSVIARVYIMVLSFYIIFVFSQINPDDYRESYIKQYGRAGKYYLFFVLRVFPFLFIYLLTIVFTMINYLNAPNWPLEPVYRLLDGRYSNTIFYSLILFVILKQKKRPGLSVPLFIIFSIIYFTADHMLYAIFEPGIGVCFIKLTKYFIFTFVLVYGYSKSRYKIVKSVMSSLITGIFLYSSVTSFLIISFIFSSPGSPSISINGRILLKSGFIFPLEKLEKNVLEHGTQKDTAVFFEFAEIFRWDTSYNPEEWEKIILRNKIENIEYIFSHLNRKKIKLNFYKLKEYAASQLSDISPDPANLKEFARHFGTYYPENKKDFFDLYKTGSESMKIIILKSLAYTDDPDAFDFLIDKISSVEVLRSDAAYDSLKKISGKDPAAELNREKYDFDVICFFRDYASKLKK